ncbi:hypothetical protein BBP40_006033 [Aspergillus hancockii]|nr:hypothetical protein BBP40_006033 [Aspergillus hancockii]
MEHVSTLCAISTVGIAATGFALGRVDRDSPKPARFRKKTFPLHDQCTRVTDPLSPLASDVHQRPSIPFATTEQKSTSHIKSFHVSGDESSSASHSQNPNRRRKSSLAGVILRRRGQTLSNPPLRAEEGSSTVLHTRRPSSSWMRRLSFQPGSRSSCQRPISPTSIGPTSPVHSRPSSQRRAPNKLIKRPPSQPSNAHPLFARTPQPPSTTSSFRRPVTSHQRSEHLRHKATHSLNFEPSLLTNATVPPTDIGASSDGIAWRPYLASTLDGLSDRLARRLSTTARPKEYGLRRILPSADTIPALLLATFVVNKDPQTLVISQETNPVSPVQFRDPFKSSDTPQKSRTSLASEEMNCDQLISAEDDTKPQVITPVNADAQSSRNTPLVRSKRRAISTHLPTLTKSEGTILVSPRSHARRNITDPSIFRRPPTTLHAEALMASGIMGSRRKIAPSYFHTDISYLRDTGQRPLTSDGVTFASTFQGSACQRPKRHSIAASDPASTVIGSDDTRIFTSGEEDETDFLTDNAFDSIRTHMTTDSNSGVHSPRVENIFDRDLTLGFADEGALHLKHLSPNEAFVSRPFENRSNLVLTPISVSVPVPHEEDMHEGESRISFPSDLTDDEDTCSLVAALPGETISRNGQSKFPNLTLNSHERAYARDVLFAHGRPALPLDLTQSDSHSFTNEAFDFCPKMNIFDWSEQPRNDREVSGTDARPRTVHGKHGPEARGSRAPGRKAPNTLHLRSQSVPVSRENTATNETRQTSGKFGTWGLGSKGVSEDWDSDFEFDDPAPDECTISESMKPTKNVTRRGMIVPQAIMERQASLHGQFGQVQELTLLVEELKRLRHQASFLDIARESSHELWKEAEGIVNLATLDDEDNGHSPPGSPSSLTFSFDDSEGESSNTNDPSKRTSGESWRASLSEHLGPNQTAADPGHKELSTKATSVLDLIYQQRMSHDSSFINSHPQRLKKLPFDTQSLRDLVVRAGAVTRALKEIIRKAEGVAPEPDETKHHSIPPFSRIFNQSSNDNVSTFETHCIA